MINGTAEWHALDTNDDGWVDMYDDPYTPFYPGDQWVDWVGMNMYHMGQVSLLLAEWLEYTCNVYNCGPAAVCVAPFALSIPSMHVMRWNHHVDHLQACSSKLCLTTAATTTHFPPVQLHPNPAFSC